MITVASASLKLITLLCLSKKHPMMGSSSCSLPLNFYMFSINLGFILPPVYIDVNYRSIFIDQWVKGLSYSVSLKNIGHPNLLEHDMPVLGCFIAFINNLHFSHKIYLLAWKLVSTVLTLNCNKTNSILPNNHIGRRLF